MEVTSASVMKWFHDYMLWIHFGVTAIFVYWMYFKEYQPFKLDPAAPSTLTTLGILGTFTGIFLGLVPFIVAIFDGTDISQNVPHLIGGIAVAAVCSISGMLLALFSKNEQRRVKATTTEEEHTGATADTLANLLQQLLEESRIHNNNLSTLQKSIAGDEDGTLLTQIQKIRTSFTDKQDQLIKSFDSFAEKMAKSNSEALIDALKEVIKDFNAKINEQFGENFKHLNEAVGKLLEWQENYRSNIEELQRQFSLCVEGIQSSKDALVTITDKSQSMVEAANRLEKLLVAYDGYRSQLAEHLEAFASLSQEAKEAFPIIQSNLKDVTESLSDTVNATIKEHRTMLEKQEKALDEIFKGFETLETRASEHTEAVFSTMEEQVEKLTTEIEVTMSQTSKRLEDQVTALDKALEEELTKSLNSLGSQLASLSGKFVSDYGPLTAKLEKLVKMSSNVSDNN